MSADPNEPDTKQLFEQLLTGRTPRPLDELLADLSSNHRPQPRRRPRVRELAVAAVAAVVIAFGIAVATRQHGKSTRTAGAARSEAPTTTLTAGRLSCAPENPGPVPSSAGQHQAYIASQVTPDDIKSHFGARFTGYWDDYYRPDLGADQRVMIAATDINPADRTWANNLPVRGGHVELVEAQYSLAELQGFAARMSVSVTPWSVSLPAPQPGFVGHPDTQYTGAAPVVPHRLLGVRAMPRLDGTDLAGDPVVLVLVPTCSEDLVHQAEALATAANVPLDVVRLTNIRP